jgi:cell division protease FtsH
VKRIMTDAHAEARRILTEHREGLETITRRLLEEEVMEGEQLRQMLGLPAAPHDSPSEATPLPVPDFTR